MHRLKVIAASGLALLGLLAVAPAPASAADPAGAAPAVAELNPTGAKPIQQGPVAGTTDMRTLCGAHAAEYGNWANTNLATPGIARIELRDCQSVTVCNGNICSTTYDAGWRTHVFGACHPTNCDWGWSAGTFRLSSGQIYGYYDQGFAKRYVYAKMSAYRPGQLWVYWRTDFVDPARADYDLQEWYVPTA